MSNKLVISLVLYQEKFSEIDSYTLLEKVTSQEDTVHLFIYDNSVYEQENFVFERENVTYIHDASNPGLAKAYNLAKQYLEQVDADLLLLLDQDTSLPETYIKFLQKIDMKQEKNVAVYVPRVYSHNRQISPVSAELYVSNKAKKLSSGDFSTAVMAINSGTVLTKKTLLDIGSFNENFSLDFLDHWLFWTLFKLSKCIRVLDYEIMHNLSVLDYSQVSLKRYTSILKAETLFYEQYATNHLAHYKRHLFFRALKQLVMVQNKKFFLKTCTEWILLMKRKEK